MRLIIAFILLPFSLFSQKFTLNELVNFACENDSTNDFNFDTVAKKRGYFPCKNGNRVGRFYEHNGNDISGEYYVRKQYLLDTELYIATVEVMYQSIHKQDYLAFKKSLKKNRFEYVKTDFDTSEYGNVITMNHYRKNDIDLLLCTGKSEDGGVVDERINNYCLFITKKLFEFSE